MIRRSHRRDSSLPPASRVRGRKKIAVMPSSAPSFTSPRVAAACANLAAGLEAVAKYAPGLALETSSLIAALSLPSARRGGRLRWEWLASTGSMLDGTPDARLLAECAFLADRILAEANVEPAIKQAAIRVHLLAARRVPLGLPLVSV